MDDESDLSPAELAARGRAEMEEAQAEAEKWAAENGLDHWSDGTPIDGQETDDSDEQIDSSVEEPSEVSDKAGSDDVKEPEGETNEDSSDNSEDEQLKREFEDRANELNDEYLNIQRQYEAALDSVQNANSIEERDRFNEIAQDLGRKQDEIRSKIISNNSNLK